MIRRVRSGTLAGGMLAALSLGSVVLYVTMGRADDPLVAANTISFLIAPLVMGGFGGLLLHRRPENVIGWLFIALAAGAAVRGVTQAYAAAAYATEPRLPLWDLAVVLQFVLWPLYLPALVLLFMLFPDGRPLSQRWAVAGAVAATAPLALIPISLFVPEAVGPFKDFHMPFALEGEAAVVFEAITFPLLALLFFGPFLSGCAALVVRYRRSRATERAQLKWLTFAAVTSATLQLVPASDVLGAWGSLLAGASFFLIPLSIVIAVLRYHLYDIDVLIRRTLIHATLSAVLIAVYVAGVATFQAVLAPFTSGNGIAVAISTLAVVALFHPARGRIQRTVDRRFYRSKYDAERTLDAFAARLREQIDLGALERELLAVVDETMQPARAQVWLRRQLSGPDRVGRPGGARDAADQPASS